jgi:hypothetical protein
VARLLKPFGIEPDSVRFGDGTRKGYLRDWFEDAWSRYLPSYPQEAEQTANAAAPTLVLEAKQDPCVPDPEGVSDPDEHCSVPHVSDAGSLGGGQGDRESGNGREHTVAAPGHLPAHRVDEPALVPDPACPHCGGRLLRWDFGFACTSCHWRRAHDDAPSLDALVRLDPPISAAPEVTHTPDVGQGRCRPG